MTNNNHSKEYLDIVDEFNVLTGKSKLRSLVHSTGLWHRSANTYFFRRRNNNIEFLVHLRSKTKDLNPNKWTPRFGGNVKAGDTVEYTALMELKEEVGLNLKLSDLIEGPYVKGVHYPNNEFEKVYFYEFNDDLDKLTFTDKEVQKVKWMLIDDILKELGENRESWAYYVDVEIFQNVVSILREKLERR